MKEHAEKERVLDYIGSDARNKLIVITSENLNLNWIDVGKEFSLTLKTKKEYKNPTIQAEDIFRKIIENKKSEDSLFGKYTAWKNIGILLEPELKLSFKRLVSSYSQNEPLFLKWDGEIEENTLYFLSKKNGIKIDLNHISHIIL